MAIYHCDVKIISRGKGRSSVAAAAYRAGERIQDERTGLAHDYSRRHDIEKEIMAPDYAPDWVYNRALLWNRVEAAEVRRDAQLAREFMVALPKELDREQQRELIREYAKEQFIDRGMIADIAIHRNDPNNPHAHIMLTMRDITPKGFGKKNREWNNKELLKEWRSRWAEYSNRSLERAGREERIDHRSLADRGEDRLPNVHLGPEVAAIEKRGTQTEKGKVYKEINEYNKTVVDLAKYKAEREKLLQEKAQQQVVQNRYKQRVSSGWKPEEAKILAKAEYKAGRELLPKDVQENINKYYIERGDIRRKIEKILSVGQRLERAEEALKWRDSVSEKLAQLETPGAKLKRVFSNSARQQYDQTKKELKCADEALNSEGVKDAADFKKQKIKWLTEQRAFLPNLQTQDKQLTNSISILQRISQEFIKALNREAQKQHSQSQSRHSCDYDRDRGYER